MSCQLPPGTRCRRPNVLNHPQSLTDMIVDYKKRIPNCTYPATITIAESVWGKDFSHVMPGQSFSEPLTPSQWDVVMSIPRNVHQRHILKTTTQDVASHLEQNFTRSQFKDFEDLYDYVSYLLSQSDIIKGKSTLLLYDIAFRLSRRYNVLPKDYVYLNGNGPQMGAKALRIPTNPNRQSYSDIVKMYPEFKRLTAYEIENFLCIYHNQLAKLFA